MLNGFKFNRWQIAYRRNETAPFTLIPNPSFGWCADPFLVCFRGEIYLFAEIYLYKSERNGVIGYCKYENGAFGKWTVTMDKHWHLSYPNVFVYDNELYMCPESYQREEVAIYRLVEFPNQWEKVKTLFEDVMYVDSTFLTDNGNNYIFTFCPTFCNCRGELLLYKMGEVMQPPLHITDDVRTARPGGNFLKKNNRLIRVSQDSSKWYGYGLAFSEVISLWPNYQEKILKRITVEDIKLHDARSFVGIHTYNCCEDFEVIDLKYQCYSFEEYLARRRVRKVFCDKYEV